MARLKREEFSTAVKREAYDRAAGRCESCSLPLQIGRFTYDHRVPFYFTRDSSLENCQVIGWCCDKPKTAQDQTDIAKSKRIQDRNAGISRVRQPFRGWRKFDGTRVMRR